MSEGEITPRSSPGGDAPQRESNGELSLSPGATSDLAQKAPSGEAPAPRGDQGGTPPAVKKPVPKPRKNRETGRPREPAPRPGILDFPVILRTDSNSQVSFGKLGSWSQASLLNGVVGQVQTIQPGSRGDWIIGCHSAQQQARLLGLSQLKVSPGVVMRITTRLPHCNVVGVILGVPKDQKAERLVRMDLQDQGYKVTKVECLRNQGQQTGAVKIVLNEPQLPRTVKLAFTRHRVVPYTPQKVNRCTNCQMLGHIRRECRRKQPRCARCARGHPTEKCQESHLYCANCGGQHAAYERVCPEMEVHIRAHEIKNGEFMPFGRALNEARWERDQRKKEEVQLLPRTVQMVRPIPKPRTLLPKKKAAPEGEPPQEAQARKPSGKVQAPPKNSQNTKSGAPTARETTKSGVPAKGEATKSKPPGGGTVAQEPEETASHTLWGPKPQKDPLGDLEAVKAALKDIQRDITRANPQAGRFFDGVFLMLNSIMDITHGRV